MCFLSNLERLFDRYLFVLVLTFTTRVLLSLRWVMRIGECCRTQNRRWKIGGKTKANWTSAFFTFVRYDGFRVTMTYFYMSTIIIQPWKRPIFAWYRTRVTHMSVGTNTYLHVRSQRLLIDIDVYRHFRGTRGTNNNYYTGTQTAQRPSISIPDRVPWNGFLILFIRSSSQDLYARTMVIE